MAWRLDQADDSRTRELAPGLTLRVTPRAYGNQPAVDATVFGHSLPAPCTTIAEAEWCTEQVART